MIELPEGGTTLLVTGSYSYLGTDGVIYTVNYSAGEDGFRPTGDHLQNSDKNYIDVYPTGIPPPVALPPNAINSLVG